MSVTHRTRLLGAAMAVGLLAPAAALAQNLNDLGRVLQDQVLGGGRQNQDRERDAYERGRQDQADQVRRERDEQARRYGDRRRFEEDRRRADEDRQRRMGDLDHRQRDLDRQRADQQRAFIDEQRAREQSRRY